MASEDAVLTSSTAQLVSIDAGGHHIVQVSNVQVDELDEEDDASQEPPPKRIKVDPEADLNMDSTLKQLMYQVNRAICMRLDKIQNNLDSLNSRVLEVENKLEQVLQQSRQQGHVFSPGSNRRGAVIVGLPQNGKSEDGLSSDGVQNLGPNVTLITLNTEEDFPQGTWLGDENNPEMRVRVPITPSDLLHIHSNCRTPEKMALTLLDYLFDRETQATSNLSGMGKHGKNQLDPLMIYGIRCHLIHRFAITESDWHRIKQNIDSKCRTAYRRKQRGMPLTVKAFRGKAPSTYVMGGSGHLLPGHDLSGASDEDSLSRDDEELHIHQGDGDIHAMQGDGISPGEIQILHATPEQISQLQQAHHIQILQGDQVIGQIPSDVANLAGLDGHHQVHMVTTDSGEVLTIQQAPSDSSD